MNVKDDAYLKDFLKEYPIPVETTIVLSWEKRTNAKERKLLGINDQRIKMFFNMKTGQKSYNLENILDEQTIQEGKYTIYECNHKDVQRYYIKYSAEVDAIIIGCARINCRTVKIDEEMPREIVDIGKMLIKRDKSTISYITSSYGTYYGYGPFNVKDLPYEEFSFDNKSYNECSEPILNLFNRYCNIGANKVVDITEHPYDFHSFLNYKEPIRRTGKKHQKIMELVSIPIEEIEYDDSYDKSVAFIQKVKDGVCVIRTMLKDEKEKKMIDAERIYVSKNKALCCHPTNDGHWISMNTNSNQENWRFSLNKFDKEAVKGTMLEYFGEIINDVPANIQCVMLHCLISWPLIEKLCKAGMKNYFLFYFSKNSYMKAIDNLKTIFGDFDDSKKSLNEKFGLNKYQFSKIVNFIDSKITKVKSEYGTNNYWRISGCFEICVALKWILGESEGYYQYGLREYVNISSVDNETFDHVFDNLVKAYNFFIEENRSFYVIHAYIESMSIVKKIYGTKTMMNVSDLLIAHISESSEVYFRSGRAISQTICNIYKDYISMVLQLDDTVRFSPYFDTIDNLVDMHDTIIEIFNTKADEIKAQGFSKAVEKCKKWVFEDDDYAIVAPKIPDDLAKEGFELHHCVKSYVPKVANGSTNILFIRKKEEIDKPFFTIEITSDNADQQVHGFGNRDLDTEPDLIPFFYKWVKEKKLKLTNFNKIR